MEKYIGHFKLLSPSYSGIQIELKHKQNKKQRNVPPYLCLLGRSKTGYDKTSAGLSLKAWTTCLSLLVPGSNLRVI